MVLYSINDMEFALPLSFAVYGAGHVADAFFKYCKNKKWNIEEVYVTDMIGNPTDIAGILVKRIDELAVSEAEKMNVVVCTAEDKHSEITRTLIKRGIKSIHYVSNKLYDELRETLGNEIHVIEQKIQQMNCELKSIENYKKFIPRPCFEVLIVNILDHCNLRCQGCDHFACIAEPYIVSKETVCSDLHQMSKLLNGDYVMRLCVMGGEPLLHPELGEILKKAREEFPNVSIRLYSNGVLLLKQDETFWECCRNNKIEIFITKYPINLDFAEMENKAKREAVSLVFWFGTDTYIKESFKKTIDLTGQHNPVESFAKCEISNFGNFLMEGKLYGCPFSCQSYRIFNKKFGQHLRMTCDDYLDIYSITDKRQMFEFAAKPKFYCRYCDGRTHTFPWKRTTGCIDEWIEK